MRTLAATHNFFSDYTPAERRAYITLANGEYYPDILRTACHIYTPVLIAFDELLQRAYDSSDLFLRISAIPDTWQRIQLCRIFRKYVSPATPVEMLKRSTNANVVCAEFGKTFRPIDEVKSFFASRPIPDEALCALLYEYKDRGKKGYDLTESFFSIMRSNFRRLNILGPRRAGSDIQAIDIWPNYPNRNRPLDFVITSKDQRRIYAVGLARYDGDRGGSQEDDRIGGYFNCANELISFFTQQSLNIKILFLNDGPGLLLGSMWSDYAKLEQIDPTRIKVFTLKMVHERISESWLTH